MIFTETHRHPLWKTAVWAVVLAAVLFGVQSLTQGPLTWQRIEERHYFPLLKILIVLAIGISATISEFQLTIDAFGLTYRTKLLFAKTKTIPWTDVEYAWVRSFEPAGEYRAWGGRYRSWFKRRDQAFTFGLQNHGLQLQLKDGRRLLFGSYKPDELEALINGVKKSHPRVFRDPPENEFYGR